jgi:5'-nucleotidase
MSNKELMLEPGFFKSLPPIKGAITAILQMDKIPNIQIFFCTSPLSSYKNCVLEKYEWVDQQLGPSWASRIVLCKDKTLVHGDILIDGNVTYKLWNNN